MIATYILHIAAGGVALLAGYTALYVSKGSSVHRRAGMAFVWSMLVMCVFGIVIAAVKGVVPRLNVPVAAFTAYLVVTSLVTVKPLRWQRQVDVSAMLLAGGVTASFLYFGVLASGSASAATRNAAPIWFVFGSLAGLAWVGDARALRGGAPTGARRVARHLWRMTLALLIAAMSFFLGQQQVFPEAARKPALLAIPVLAVLATLLYWLWRVRIRSSLRGVVIRRVSAQGAPATT